MLTERAPAKVNLSLHVTGRRPDGYHLLESLVVFASAHDILRLEPADRLTISVSGPRAAAAGPDDDNLVIKAARNLSAQVEGLLAGHFTLDKHLPAAAGLGGGSSDAAAALRLLARLNSLPANDTRLVEAARMTGADVSVCLDPRPAMMRGIGDDITRLDQLPELNGVLVNPGRAVETRAVFTALGLQPGGRHAGKSHPDFAALASADDVIARLADTANHLEPPAVKIAPVIADVKAALETTDARLVRMSGSGASVFALYGTAAESAAAARRIAGKQPSWWVEAVSLGTG